MLEAHQSPEAAEEIARQLQVPKQSDYSGSKQRSAAKGSEASSNKKLGSRNTGKSYLASDQAPFQEPPFADNGEVQLNKSVNASAGAKAESTNAPMVPNSTGQLSSKGFESNKKS